MPISTAYDQRYSCHDPVTIELDDGKGNTALVIRLQAQQLRPDQHCAYLENDLSQPHAVLFSEKAYKGGQWLLRLQGFGSLPVEPGHYFNCLTTL